MGKVRKFDRSLLALSMCAGLALASALFAAEGNADPVGAEMKAMDSNHDGMVSTAEHAAGAKTMYEKMDTDHNGQVTTVEMDASHKAMMKGKDTSRDMSSASKIKTMDTNNDGKLSAEEHATGAQKMFESMDSNHDNQLSEDEMRIGHDAMQGGTGY